MVQMTKRPYPFTMPVFVGIDPQQKFLSVNVATEKGEVIAWWNHILKRKQSSQFGTAQDWQEYIYRECLFLLETEIFTMCRKGGYSNIEIKEVGLEQQKGRVNTIIEQAILDVCIRLQLPRRILHPVTWKKQTEIPCTGSNKENKEACVQRTKHEMKAFFGEEKLNQLGKTEEGRIHDYCDAFRIRQATQRIHNSKKESGKTCQEFQQSNTSANQLARSTPTLASTGMPKLGPQQ